VSSLYYRAFVVIFKKMAIEKNIENDPVVRLTNSILVEGIKKKASDILIEPLEKNIRIRYRIDGLLREGFNPPKSIHSQLLIRIKVMAKLNISEKRLPQDGRFKLRVERSNVDFRVSIVPSSLGEKVALRILDKSALMLNLEKLGFDREEVRMLREATKHPHGMILICGPTGCGKTTTLYSLLHLVDQPEINITSTEDPVEYEIPGINQVAINPAINLTFANSLRSILRQDPDIIMVGEIRDAKTLDIAIKSALTGHLVLSSFHSMDTPGAITRLSNMGAEPFLITSCVLLVAAQRLVRNLCPHCKKTYQPPEKILQALKISSKDEAVFYQPKGCSQCQGFGYSGRLGVIEVLPLNKEIKELIMKRSSESEIRKKAQELGMKTLRENAIKKLLSGETSIEEIVRVTIDDK